MTQPAAAHLAPLSRYKFCGNCARAHFNLNSKELQLLKNLAERDGLRTMRSWTRSRKPLFTLGRYSDIDRQQALKIILENQVRCLKTKTRVAWPDQACFKWQAASELPSTS